jgi:UDP-glucose 4-epimerase
MANYLVTGAAGFIGAAIAKKLVKEGHDVVTIDNLSTGFEAAIPEGVQFFKGDCADASIYEKIPQHKYDAILHIAGQSSGEISFDDPIYDIQTNAESTLLQLKFALKNGCKRYLYASTMSVYGNKPDMPISEEEECFPESFYGVAKLASEHYLRIYKKYGINSTCLRLFNVYGPGQNLDNLRQGMVSIYLAQMLNDEHIHVKGSPDRFRDFIYIDDVVESFVRCLSIEETWGLNINIATGRRTTVQEVIEQLIKNQDKEISVQYSGNTAGDIHGIYADVSLMRKVVGLSDLTNFEDGVSKFIKKVSR